MSDTSNAGVVADATVAHVQLRSGERFACAAGTSILDAAQAAGLTLEHSCKTGRCGSCRGRVLQGRALPLMDTPALSEQEVADGWVLSCAHTASSELLLDCEALPATAMQAPVTVPARIAALSFPSPDVARVVLRFPPSARLHGLPGQHVDVRSPQGAWRRYSVANLARPGEPIELHVRRVPGGSFSGYLFEGARVDDLLRVRGPLGTFWLRPWAGRQLVFLATGTGIAPVLAMLSQLDALPPDSRPAGCTLYWGARTAEALYLDPASMRAGRSDWLRVVPVLSRADASWPGARGHVQDALLGERATLAATTVYACGSARMVADARQQLSARGLEPGHFHSDAFVSSS